MSVMDEKSVPLRYQVPLAEHTTFGVEATAERYLEVDSAERLRDALKLPELRDGRILILGGGSNVLFTGDPEGTLLHNRIRGIEHLKDEGEELLIRVGGGEEWHGFVRYCVKKGYAGVENLSLIPGSVGAAPMQNIGAYGVELKEVFEELEAFDLQTGTIERFRKADCEFGYRSSVFKTRYKDRFMILSVTFRLSRVPHFNTSYASLKEELERMGVEELSLEAVSRAVINVRRSKLPDPSEIGNAGSFFKNPVVDEARFRELKTSHPDIKAFPQDDGSYKLAAGWLIEKAGWKGVRLNDHGVHEKQALVLVNYGRASGEAIRDLAFRIRDSVKEGFGVELQPEVNIL